MSNAKLTLIVDLRHPAYTYYMVQGLGYRQGRRLEQQGWQWARAFDGAPGCWFHTDESIALPAFERLGIQPVTVR